MHGQLLRASHLAERSGELPDGEHAVGAYGLRFQTALGDGFPAAVGDRPADFRIFERRRAEVVDLGLCREGFVFEPGAFRVAEQRHGRRAEGPPILGRHQALGVPERIEHTHRGVTLAREVVERQELKSGRFGRAEQRLDHGLVLHDGQRARGPEEVVGLIAHAVGGEHLAPQFEVSGLDRSRVFPDLAEVGIDAPLARLVGNDRNVHVRLLAAVPVGRGPSLVDLHGAFVGLLRDVILVGRDARAGRRTAVQMPRVEFAAVGGQLLDEVEVAGDLVAVAVEDERGVVAVLLEDGAHLAAEEVVARFVRLGVLAPHGHLDFEVDAVAVGHAESRGGRAPRVETDVVQSVVLDDAHDTLPFGVADRGVARFREHGVLDGSAQVERTAVEQDVVAALRHFAHAERRRLLMFEGLLSGAGQQRALHGVEVRVEFVPEFGLPAQRDGFGQVDLLRYVQAVARDGEQRLSFERLFRAVVDLQAHVDAVRREVGIQLHVVDVNGVYGHEFHLAEDAVPVDLRELRVGVVPFVGVVLEPVVDAHRDAVRLARGDEIRQVVVVGDADVVQSAHLLGVDPYRAEPVGALEIEEDALALPVGRELDVALIPRRTHVLVDARQAVDMAVGRFVADFVVVGDAGEHDGLLELVVVARRKRSPAEIHHVRLEPPLSREVHFAGLGGRRGEGAQQHGREKQFYKPVFHVWCCFRLSFQVFVREFHELPPVVERDVVVARTDVVADVSRQHGRVGLGQFRSRKSLQAEQLVDRRGVDPREELAFRIGPTVLDGAGDIHRARGYQRNQFVLVDGQSRLVARIPVEVPAKPMREKAVDPGYGFAVTTPRQRRAAQQSNGYPRRFQAPQKADAEAAGDGS